MTRSRSDNIRGRSFHRVVIVFSHISSNEVKRITLSQEREDQLRILAGKASTSSREAVSLPEGLAFWTEEGRHIFALFNAPESYDTNLIEDGALKIDQALEVREFLDCQTFSYWYSPHLRDDLIHELLFLSLTYTVRRRCRALGEDYHIDHYLVIPIFKSIVVESEILFEKICETLGFDLGLPKQRTLAEFKKLLPSTYDSLFTEPSFFWMGKEAFVHSVYRLHLS